MVYDPTTPAAGAARRDRTREELRRLQESFASWLGRRREVDADAEGVYIGRHKTQLEALESLVVGAAIALGGEAEALDPNDTAGVVHDRCRELDEATAWLTRVWEFHREKFDQRDDPSLAPLLRAADDIAWSGYHEIMDRARQHAGTPHGPPPLSYLAPEYSPAALDAGSPLRGPLALTLEIGDLDPDLAQTLHTLPMPFLRLPLWSAAAPWWLLYIGHEIGHHVIERLDLLGSLSERLEVAAGGAGLSTKEARQWRRWTEEIFADVISVLLMGGRAVWAIAEAEWSEPPRLERPLLEYPPPLVRLELIAAAAERLGYTRETCLGKAARTAVAARPAALAAHFSAIPAALEVLLGPLPGELKTLAWLCDFDRARFEQEVRYWRDRLIGGHTPPIQSNLRTARVIAAASADAWSGRLDPKGSGAGARPLARLAEVTLEALSRSAPPGTRVAALPSGRAAVDGAGFAHALLLAVQRRREEAVWDSETSTSTPEEREP